MKYSAITGATCVHTPHSKKLEEKLLSLAGDTACVFDIEGQPESSLLIDVLLGFGRLSNGKGARLKQMERSNCHWNVEKLATRYPHIYQRETGYAMGPGDGTWRRHSWAFDTRKNQIVETTALRDKYFGFTQNRPLCATGNSVADRGTRREADADKL